MTALTVAIVGLVAAWTLPGLLAAARWPSRFPRAGMVAWLLMFLATYGTVLAACLSMVLHLPPIASAIQATVPGHTDELMRSYTHIGGRPLDAAVSGAALALTGATIAAVAIASRRISVERRRHLTDLELVARPDHGSGVLLVDAPQPAAYAVPGRRSAVVLTSATQEVLTQPELEAVLTHERTHLRFRHAWLVGPAAALAAAAPWLPGTRDCHAAVRLLIEMHADDAAARRTSPLVTATALIKLAGSGSPAVTLSMAGGARMALRIERLLDRVAQRRVTGRLSMVGGLAGLAAMVGVSLAVIVTPVASAAMGAATCSHRLDADCLAIDDAGNAGDGDADAGAGS